jgi:hypothetical protein
MEIKMELLNNQMVIVSLNIFAVGLWVITIIFFIIKNLKTKQIYREEVSKENKDIGFNETLKKKISNSYEKIYPIPKLGTELMDVNKLYNSKMLHNKNWTRNELCKSNKKTDNFIMVNRTKSKSENLKDGYKSILTMSKMGMTPIEIAKKMERPMGEVELVMKMNSNLH